MISRTTASLIIALLLLVPAVTYPAGAPDRIKVPEANIFSSEMSVPEFDKSARALETFCIPGLGFMEDAQIEKKCGDIISMRIEAEHEHLLAQYKLEMQFLDQELNRFSRRSEIVERIFKNQTVQGSVVFWLAVTLSVLGVAAAGAQFFTVFHDSNSESEVRISAKEVTIKTAWIGVVILAASMLFLAFVIFYVYQISPATLVVK